MKARTSKIVFRITNLTFRTKLAWLVGLLIGGIAIFIFWYFPSVLESHEMKAVAGRIQSIATMTSFNIAPAIVFEDREAMEESFNAARQNKDLVYIVAVGEQGKVLFSHNMAIADSAGYKERASPDNITPDGNIYGEVSSINFQNREIGRIFLGFSLQGLKAEVAKSRTAIALVSLAIFLVGIFSVLAIATIITAPLRKMSQAAQQITQGTMSARAPVYSNDEMGKLAKTFNLMVDNLSMTQKEIQVAASQLTTLFDNLEEVFWSIDVTNNVTLQMSPACESLYGYPADAFFKNPMLWYECIVPEDRRLIDEKNRDVFWGKPVQAEHRIIRSDGAIRWVEVKVKTSIDPIGKVIRLDAVVSDVSARRTAKENLKIAEEKYRGIFENAVVGIFQTTIDGRYSIVNPTLSRMYGYGTPDELIAMYGDLNHSFYVKSGRKTEFITLMIQHGGVSGLESQVYRKDRSIIWISVSARVMRDASGAMTGFEGTAVDITERKRAEESTSRLLRAVEQTDEVVLMTEIDGTITYVNPAFEKLYGYSKNEVLGKTPRILKSGRHDNAYYEGFWRELFLGIGFQGEHINKTKAGDEVFVQVAVSPVYNTENVLTGFISVQKDITKRKREEEERKSLEMHLAQTQKIESIGTLAGGIAHDFNNILTIILGHIDLINRGSNDPKRLSSSLGSINTAVNRGAGLVKQILTFARKADVLFECVPLNEIVAEMKMLHETFPKTITFKTNLNGLNLIIEGDRTQLHQTLLNLCVNARDAMPDGGSITITIEEETADDVRRTSPDAGNDRYAKVSVTDTGSGMDQETARRIFEPFFTTKEKGKGTGLGLAVVYGIVKSHRGFIDVKSEPAHGTTFSLHFPIIRQKEEMKESSSAETHLIQGGQETILVVEDEEILLTLLESVLTSHGYTVLTADDGEKAVEVYSKHQHEIAVVVTDLGLPKMSGQAAFMKMKELNPHVKAIFASGYIGPELKAVLSAAGAKSIISKPYLPSDILNLIRETLEPESILA